MLDWESEAPMHTVEYRVLPDGPWQSAPHVKETDYNLILLKPATAYEARVRGDAGISNTVAARTDELRPTTFAGLRIAPPAPLDTFTTGTWYPTVEYYDGAYWVVEALDNALQLSRLDAATRRVEWTKEVLAKFPDRPAYQGIMDTAVHDKKLWIMWNFQDTNNPAGYEITQSRQMMRSYDFATGELSEPVSLPAARPEAGAWEGGVASWRGELWTLQMDAWLEEGKRRTRIVLRSFKNGKFGEPVVYDTCPTSYPYGPSMGVFGDDLVLLFSDLQAYEKDSGTEPLYYTVFDGKSFAPARALQEKGRSRYAKGVQLGDRFVCAYKCNVPYYRETGNRFHDIALTAFEPRSGDARTTMLVADLKYNSSPDICRTDTGGAALVFGKWEHIYTDKKDPATNHGGFIAEIRRVP